MKHPLRYFHTGAVRELGEQGTLTKGQKTVCSRPLLFKVCAEDQPSASPGRLVRHAESQPCSRHTESEMLTRSAR